MINVEATPKAKSKVTRADIQFMTRTAISIALVFVATAFINVRLPIASNGGLVHLGNVALFVAAVLFGKKTGAIAGGIGMGIFDITSGWAIWAPFTVIIVGAMGFAVGQITEKRKTVGWIIASMVVALVIKVVGYYVAEIILYGNWLAPAASIPGNIVQVFVGGFVALPVISALKRALRIR